MQQNPTQPLNICHRKTLVTIMHFWWKKVRKHNASIAEEDNKILETNLHLKQLFQFEYTQDNYVN